MTTTRHSTLQQARPAIIAPNMNARQIVTNTAQPLPTWLSYSPIVGPSGTSYTVLRFPLTYYGPSIPLGTDGVWTYGGLTSPAPTTTAVPTSTPPSVTTSPPTTSLASSTSLLSTSTSTTRRTTSFASVSISTRRPTASTAPTQTGTPGGSSKLPPVAIALIVLGALAAVLLCCLIGALLWRRRKSRRDREPPRGDSEFYAGPPPDDVDSIHAVPNLFGERHSLLGNDSFIVVPGSGNGRSHLMTQRSFGGVSYQRLGESRAPSMVSRRTGSDEIGVAYTDMPPPRSRRRTVTAVSNAVSSSPSHPTSSSRPGIGSMRSHNESQRSSLFERPAAQDESPVLPRDSTNGVVKRASDLGARPLQAPAPAAQSPTQYGQGATLGSELGMLGLGTRYPDPSQSLLATSSSGGSFPPRLVVPTPSSLGSRSRVNDWSRPASQFVAGASMGGSRTSRASRGHSPEPSGPTPPPRDTLTWPESPESEHDESAQLLTADRENVRSGIGLLGRFSWFARGNGSNGSPAARTSRNSYPGWMSPPTEEGFLAEADEGGPSASNPPTLESKPPTSHPGMVRLVTRQHSDPPPRPISSTSGNTVYHDAPSQPTTPRTQVSTWLGFLGRASPASGPAPPVPQRPSPLSQTPTSTPVAAPSTSITPPLPVRTRDSTDSDIDPASRPPRVVSQPRISTHSDILDAPAPESLLDLPPPTLVPPPSPAPVFPPGLTRLPRTWNFGLLNELGDEPPAAEERWANIRSTPDMTWDLRRFSLGRAVQVHSPHALADSQVASVHGGTTSPTTTDPHRGPISEGSSRSRQTGNGSSENSRPSDADSRRATAGGGNSTRHSVSMSAPGTSADTNTVSSNHPSTLVMTESGHFGGFGYVDSEYDDDYETHATSLSFSSYDSSGREAVDLHGEPREEDLAGGQDVYLRGGERFMPPMSAVGISGWDHQDSGRA